MTQEAWRLFGQEKVASSGGETAAGHVNYDPIEVAAIRKEGKTYRNLVAGFDTKVSEFFNKWRTSQNHG